MIKVSKVFIDAFYDSRKTQLEFASDINISPNRLSLFLNEKDRPSMNELDKICQSLGCEVQDVIKYEEE